MELKMPRINKVQLAGSLAGDPELRYTNAGVAVCTFRVAVEKHWRDKNSGEKKKQVRFFNARCWGPLAEFVGEGKDKNDKPLFRIGMPVYIDGENDYDEWTDKATGQKRTKYIIRAFSVQSLAWSTDSKKRQAEQQDGANKQPAPESDPPTDGPQDEIPF